MAPTIGRTVLVLLKQMGEPRIINGSDEHPAIVSAVHGETMINARVFQDNGETPIWETSIPHVDTAGEGYTGSTWRWPPREDAAAAR